LRQQLPVAAAYRELRRQGWTVNVDLLRHVALLG
jgi:hypothetical protein